MNNGGQGSLGLYASPLGDTTNYMAVLGGGSEEIAYSSFNTSFGLYWGSVDTYNSLAFYSGSVLVATITGAESIALSANGGQTDYASNAYVWITALPQFDRVFAASSSNAFEFDNIVAGSATTSFPPRSLTLDLGHAAVWLRRPRLCGFPAKQDANLGCRLIGSRAPASVRSVGRRRAEQWLLLASIPG